MFWGGLRPIRSRVALDAATICALLYCANSSIGGDSSGDGSGTTTTGAIGATLTSWNRNTLVLSVAYGITFLGTRGGSWTNRWPLSFPMVPLLLVQFARRCPGAGGRWDSFVAGDDDDWGGTHSWIYNLLSWESILWLWGNALIGAAALLCVLFPAVELKAVRGRYAVGVVDLFLPVDFDDGTEERTDGGAPKRSSPSCTDDSMAEEKKTEGNDPSRNSSVVVGERSKGGGFVTARIFYPTARRGRKEKSAATIPYLDPSDAHLLCNELMKCSAPPPLNKMGGWMLHTWRLIQVAAQRDAPPLAPGGDGVEGRSAGVNGDRSGSGNGNGNGNGSGSGKGWPVAVYSHGLMGNAAVYTHQGRSLAANGIVCLMVTHRDGSCPATKTEDGSHVFLDRSIFHLWKEGKEVECVRARRSQTDRRAAELLAATRAMLDLNRADVAALRSRGVSFVGHLDAERVTVMGHSFGGATALTAAARRPDLVRAVVAHEPAVDWMTDDARRALFHPERMAGSPHDYGGGTGGYEDDDRERDHPSVSFGGGAVSTKEERAGFQGQTKSLHDIDMLVLYSEQWHKMEWGGSKLLSCMYKRKQLGPPGGDSEVGVIAHAHHQEFSDICALTPLWLARVTGATGKRNPLDTLDEIWEKTLRFIELADRDS